MDYLQTPGGEGSAVALSPSWPHTGTPGKRTCERGLLGTSETLCESFVPSQ